MTAVPVQLLPVSPIWREFDANGDPLVGGLVNTYAAGTTTPLATYTDSTGTTQNTNPVVLNAYGEASIWFTDAAYKVVVTDAAGNAQWTQDNVTTGSILAALASTSDVAKGDALIGVKSPLTGGVARTEHDRNTDYVNVKDFGAKGDGTTNDTAAFVAAMSSDVSQIYIPEGTYCVLDITPPSGITLFGDGPNTMLKEVALADSQWHYVIKYDTVSNCIVRNMTLDGNGNNVYNSEHMAGIFIKGSSFIDIENVVFQNTRGDGITVAGNGTLDVNPSRHIRVYGCRFMEAGRGSIILGSGWENVLVEGCQFFGPNGAIIPSGRHVGGDFVHSEPEYAQNCSTQWCIVKNNFFDGTLTNESTESGGSNVACKGMPAQDFQVNFIVVGNKFYNSRITDLEGANIVFMGNIIKINTDDPKATDNSNNALHFSYGSHNVVCSGNIVDDVVHAQALTITPGMVQESVLTCPYFVISGNIIKGKNNSTTNSSMITICDNIFKGDGSDRGLDLAITTGYDTTDIKIDNNTFENFTYGTYCSPSGTSSLLGLSITNNNYKDCGTGIYLRNNSGASPVDAFISGNNFGGTFTHDISLGSSMFYRISGNGGPQGTACAFPAVYVSNAVPTGLIIAPKGCQCINTAGSTGTSFYVKESGTNATGWVAK